MSKKPYIARDTKEPLVVMGGYRVAADGGILRGPLLCRVPPGQRSDRKGGGHPMTEYAGSIYATDRQALAAAWYDYLTAGGNNSREDAVRFAKEGVEANLREATEDGWQWPGEPDLDDHKSAMADALVSLFDDWSPAENGKETTP